MISSSNLRYEPNTNTRSGLVVCLYVYPMPSCDEQDFMRVYTAYVNNYNDVFRKLTDYADIPEVLSSPTSF